MVSCCSGAELQVREAGEVVLRELFPMKSDLYERANELKAEYGAAEARSSFLTGGRRSGEKLFKRGNS